MSWLASCTAATSASLKVDGGGGREADVLVIGAGIAGLRAAEVLTAAGKTVIVLEGRDRTGGRIWTDRSWGVPLDLGASWIHGVTGNPIAARAQAAGIRTVAADYSEALYDPRGIRQPDGAVQTIEHRVNALATAGRANSPDSDEPLRAALDRALTGAHPSDVKRLEYEMGITSVFEHEYAADTSELSANHFDDGAKESGGDVLFPGGYDQIVSLLQQGRDIRTGAAVLRIDSSSSGVATTTAQGVFQARAAIVTVPLGVLKAGSITFGTPLSPAKTAAIQRLGMGALSKTYLRFPQSFWPTDVDLMDRIPPAAARAQWVENLNVAKFHPVPALLMFNAGAFARSVEALSNADAIASAALALRSMFGAATMNPVASLRSQWTRDPFSLGAYSFLAVGATLADRDALAAREGAVFFAGEACSRDHAATVHGAYTSGEAAANSALTG